jgi:outer membrane protein OmpA-like peptidoglycan-associated protein
MNLALILALTVAFAPLAVARETCGTCCTAEKKHGCSKCRHECEPTQFASPDQVHWVHKGVSFGNYMKFAKAELPAPCEGPDFCPIYFDFDKSFIRPDQIENANKIVQYLKAHPDDRIRIEGNCCDIGTNEYNMGLGRRRAESLKKYLVENGIDAARITTVSNGEEKPKHPISERHLNRRDDAIVWLIDAAK